MDRGALQAPWDFPGKNPGVGCHFFSRDLSVPGIEPTSPELAGRFFTAALIPSKNRFFLKVKLSPLKGQYSEEGTRETEKEREKRKEGET